MGRISHWRDGGATVRCIIRVTAFTSCYLISFPAYTTLAFGFQLLASGQLAIVVVRVGVLGSVSGGQWLGCSKFHCLDVIHSFVTITLPSPNRNGQGTRKGRSGQQRDVPQKFGLVVPKVGLIGHFGKASVTSLAGGAKD